MVAVVVAIFAVLRLDPYTTLFTWWTDVDKRPWNTFIAPLLGIAGLLPFLWYAVTGMDVLLGGGGWLQITFTTMLFASLAIGIIGAYLIRARSPRRYAELNSTLGDRI